MNLSNTHILLLRLVIAGLFLNTGIDKYNEGWLSESSHLAESLNSYHERASGMQLTYLDNVAIPHAGLWSRAICIGEIALGTSLLLGLLVRLSTALGIFMVINLHAATGNLYSLNFFASPYAALLTTGLLVLLLARAGRWAGIDALLATANPKALFW